VRCLQFKLLSSKQAYGATINDSFRSVEEQAAAYARYQAGGGLAAPPGRSYHGKGLALDVGPAAIYTKLHQISQQYGIFNPPGIRGRDPVHFQMGNCDAACQSHLPPETAAAAAAAQQPDATQKSPGPQAGGGTKSDPQQQFQPQQPPQKKVDVVNLPSKPAVSVAITGDMKLTCSPAVTQMGAPVTVAWECPAATRAVGYSKQSASFAVKNIQAGTVNVIVTAPTTYVVSCVKSSKVIAKSSCEVAVESKEKQLRPYITLSVSPRTIQRGDVIDVSWTSNRVRSCVLKGPGVDSVDTSGRMTVSDVNSSGVYVLTCAPLFGKIPLKKTIGVTLDEAQEESVEPADAL
jgi:D-alanyl-D-alanine carboxypeptidase